MVKNHLSKKFFSFILAGSMALSMISPSAFATESSNAEADAQLETIETEALYDEKEPEISKESNIHTRSDDLRAILAAEESDEAQTEISEEPAEERNFSKDLPKESSEESSENAPVVNERKKEETVEALDTEKETDKEFDSARLIVSNPDSVKSEDNIIGEIDGVYLLQYDSPEEAKEEYEFYKEEGNSDFVSPDSIFVAADDINVIEEIDPETTKMDADENPFVSYNDTNADFSDKMDDDHERMPVIAVIDSGASENDNVIARYSVIGDDVTDRFGHGDNMISAITHINPEAKIVSIKALDDNGIGSVSSVYAAIKMAIENNVDVINLSMYAIKTDSTSIIEDVIKEAIDKGITVIGAAGNSSNDAAYYVPGCINDAFIIGAVDKSGNKISTSNFGKSVDYYIEAPNTSLATAYATGYWSIEESFDVYISNDQIIDGSLVSGETSYNPEVREAYFKSAATSIKLRVRSGYQDFNYSNGGLYNGETSWYLVQINGTNYDAWCLDPKLSSPALWDSIKNSWSNHNFTVSEYANTSKMAAAMYWTTSGNTGDVLKGKSAKARYILQHCIFSYIKNGTASFTDNHGNKLNSASQTIVKNYVSQIETLLSNNGGSIPYAAMSIKKADGTNTHGRTCYLDGSRQRTELMTFSAHPQQSITFTNLPDGVKVYNQTLGKNSATVHGGEKFYFTAPLTISAQTYSTTVTGSITNDFHGILLNNSTSARQDLGYVYTTSNKQTWALTITFKAYGNITVKKVVKGTGASTSKNFAFSVKVGSNTTTFNLKDGGSKSLGPYEAGTSYTVTETADDDYTTTWSSNRTGTIPTGNKTVTVTATNTIKPASLYIRKDVYGTGADTSKKFTITITLKDASGNNISASYPYTYGANLENSGTLKFTNGTATVKLCDNERALITNLPVSYKWTATETVDSAYTAQSKQSSDASWQSTNAQSGTFKANTQSYAYFGNTIKPGNLYIRKDVSGTGADTNKKFTFTITLKNASGSNVSASYPYQTSVSPADLASAGNLTFTNGTATISLKDNERAKILNLPPGYKYTVTETTDSAYTTQKKAASTDAWASGNSLSGTIAANTQSSAYFLNTVKPGSLKITKTVTGTNKNFTFTIKITDASGNAVNTNFSYSGSKSGTLTKGQGTVTLSNGQNIVIANIPPTYKYTVTETSDSSYTTTSRIGSATYASGYARSGSITANTQSQVDYKNEIKKGKLAVKKTVIGEDIDITKKFTFTITITDNNGASITESFPYTGTNGVESGTIYYGHKTIELAHNQSILIEDIPNGYNYIVRETSDPEYVVNPGSGQVSGTIAANTTRNAFFENTIIPSGSKLIITKKTDGIGVDTDKAFAMHLVITDENGDPLTVDDALEYTGSLSGSISLGELDFALKSEQFIIVTGIEQGWHYQIIEDEYDDYIPDPESRTIEGVFDNDDEDAEYTVIFTNTVKPGGLTLTKQVNGRPETSGQKFAFDIEITTDSGNAVNSNFTYTGSASGELINGAGTVELADGESITIANIPATYHYTISEHDILGYAPEIASGEIEGDIIANVVNNEIFENNVLPGSLVINKTLLGAGVDVTDKFPFTLTIKDENGATPTIPLVMTGDVTGGSLNIIGGVVSFELADGETVTVDDIPAGYTYTVNETDPGEYKCIPEGGTINDTIHAGVISTAAFTNMSKPGSLKLTKKVNGKGENPNQKFTFDISITTAAGSEVENTFQYTGSASGELVNGTGTVELADGESITINDIPPTYRYTITERETEGYRPVIETGEIKGEIVSEVVNNEIFENNALPGSLVITKTVTGEGADTSDVFPFTLTIRDDSGNVPDKTFVLTGDVPGGYMNLTNGSASFGLSDGQSVSVEGIPAGYTYTVTETDRGNYKCIPENGIITDTIHADQISMASFTNMVMPGSLTIKKTIDSETPDTDAEFTFNITITDSSGDAIELPLLYTGDKAGTFNGGVLSITLKHNESITVNDIPVGYKFTVKEIDDDDYIVTPASGEFTGTIVKNTESKAEFINKPKTGILTLIKRSGNAEFTEDKECYTLKGALYQLYASREDAIAGTNPILGEPIVTDDTGSTDDIELEAGVYYVKEIHPSHGFRLCDGTSGDGADRYGVHEVTITVNKTTTVTCVEPPDQDPIRLVLTKMSAKGDDDADRKKLEGALFRLEYFDNLNGDTEYLKNYWYFKTNDDGILNTFDTNCYVKDWIKNGTTFDTSDDLYLASDETPVYPLGTYKIYEVQEPEYYKLEGTMSFTTSNEAASVTEGLTFVLDRDDNTQERVYTSGGNVITAENLAMKAYNTPNFGSLTVQKFSEGDDIMDGVQFRLVAEDDTVYEGVTDENGICVFDELPTGTYTLTETATHKGSQLLPDNITVTIPISKTAEEVNDENLDIAEAVLNPATGKYEFWDPTINITDAVLMELPMTGDNNKMLYAGLVVALGFITSGMYIVARRRRHRI